MLSAGEIGRVNMELPDGRFEIADPETGALRDSWESGTVGGYLSQNGLAGLMGARPDGEKIDRLGGTHTLYTINPALCSVYAAGEAQRLLISGGQRDAVSDFAGLSRFCAGAQETPTVQQWLLHSRLDAIDEVTEALSKAECRAAQDFAVILDEEHCGIFADIIAGIDDPVTTGGVFAATFRYFLNGPIMDPYAWELAVVTAAQAAAANGRPELMAEQSNTVKMQRNRIYEETLKYARRAGIESLQMGDRGAAQYQLARIDDILAFVGKFYRADSHFGRHFFRMGEEAKKAIGEVTAQPTHIASP